MDQIRSEPAGNAAIATPPTMSAEPPGKSAVIALPSRRFASVRLTASVVRNPTEETMVGNFAVLSTTHQVPIGPATKPI